LPPEQASLLQQAYWEDRSHRDIAETTQIPLGTVKSRIRLALTRLRAVLKDE
jgi:RNA polymerase sigma-70 factor (ECF subfamily)